MYPTPGKTTAILLISDSFLFQLNRGRGISSLSQSFFPMYISAVIFCSCEIREVVTNVPLPVTTVLFIGPQIAPIVSLNAGSLASVPVVYFHISWYTVDGGALGELEYECFNAASCLVKVKGISIHPGDAKNQMINASLVAMEFAGMLPPWERPEHTEGYEGFYHLTGMSGCEEEAELKYILRDHDAVKLEQKKETVRTACEALNRRYGEGTVSAEIRDSYRNMREIVEQHPDVIERAKKAFRANGVEPAVQPIRGGTDGARLSFMGLPCPNLSTGGYNFHGRKELIPVPAMEKMVHVLVSLVTAE